MSPLDEYTDDQLLEELAKRAKARKKPAREKPEHFCDECAHFRIWKAPGLIPDSFNPCDKGHAMAFLDPDGYPDDEWRFHRDDCPDRSGR